MLQMNGQNLTLQFIKHPRHLEKKLCSLGNDANIECGHFFKFVK